ncbi:hypothetical protein BKA82DRAFT_1005777, partial [Pisolithus tinctorius]
MLQSLIRTDQEGVVIFFRSSESLLDFSRDLGKCRHPFFLRYDAGHVVTANSL